MLRRHRYVLRVAAAVPLRAETLVHRICRGDRISDVLSNNKDLPRAYLIPRNHGLRGPGKDINLCACVRV